MADFEFEDDELEQEQEREQNEPQTELPQSADRDSVYADAESEGVEDAVLDQLAEKDEITVDDLRQIPGSERMTDEQLEAAWEAALKQAGVAGKTIDEGTKVELPFPVYDKDGNKVAKDKVTLEGLFDGSLQIGYNAIGKEQRKALSDVVRNASQGHWNEHRYQTVQGQLGEATRKLQDFEKKVAEASERENIWNAALTAIIAGDKAPLEKLINAYRQALTTSGANPEGFVSRDQVAQERELEQRGMEFHQNVIVPQAYEIAQAYGANPKEVIGAIQYFIEHEPMLTAQRIEEIIKYDVPMAFESNGYSRSSSQADGQSQGTKQDDDRVAKLEKELEAVRTSLAQTKNDSTQRAREKTRKAPPAGSGSIAGAGDSMPNFKSRSQFKAWSQGDPDWQKA